MYALRDAGGKFVGNPDGTTGFFAPGGPPTYMFVSGRVPGDEDLPGAHPSEIGLVTMEERFDRPMLSVEDSFEYHSEVEVVMRLVHSRRW